jgi:hypothetical protein
MDATTAIAVGLACAAVAAFAGWRGARPPDLRRGPRLIPWRGIMVFTAAAAVVTLGIGLRALAAR